MVAKRKNVGGRPRQGEQVKRAPLNLRTDPRLRERIEDAADSHGWSLTQEVETRLISSFTLEQECGGPHIRSFTTMLAAAMFRIETRTGKRWNEDRTTFAAVRSAIDLLLKGERPRLPAPEDGPLEQASSALTIARDKWKAARSALNEYREANGIRLVAGVEFPLIAPRHGMFGNAIGPSFMDARANWTNEQRQTEAELVAAEAEANAEHTKAMDAMHEAFEPIQDRYVVAEREGRAEADHWLGILGPKPVRKAETAERDC